MQAFRVPVTRPETDGDEAAEVAAVLASGFLTQGPRVAEFEDHIADLTGMPHAVATTSGTTALHLSLAALGIGVGDEVLVPDYTFPATANVVVQTGARPVLVDIDPTTFAIDPEDAASRLSSRTRAVMPVHPFGLPADLEPILRLAANHGLFVIEDAACALAATYRGAHVGTLGTLGCFSFHPRKSITTGEGGVVVTRDETLSIRLRQLRSHGAARSALGLSFVEAGFNYRLSDILAAVGIAQLRKLPALVARRRELAERYRGLLAQVPGISLPSDPAWGQHVFQSFVVLLPDGVDRDGVVAKLREGSVEATIGTYALHREPFFRTAYGYRPGDLPVSDKVFRTAVTLPLYPSMASGDQDLVVDLFTTAVGAAAT